MDAYASGMVFHFHGKKCSKNNDAENNLICKNAVAWTPDRDQSEELDACGYWCLRG